MQIAKVIGSATATVKHASMIGARLLIVQPLKADRQTPDGDLLLTADGVGAGRGEYVMITSDSARAKLLLNDDTTPVSWTIIGVCDQQALES